MKPRMPAEERDNKFQWDWVTLVIILVGAVLLFLLTFELWVPHTGGPN